MNSIPTFHWLSRSEGASYLLLLLVAMPLKYLFDLPLAVRIVGSLHGALFVLLVLSAARVTLTKALTHTDVLRVLGWSLAPLGFLLAERVFKRVTDAHGGITT